MNWQDMKTAPRDGTTILVARNNDCFWEYYAVWWVKDEHYPWQSSDNAFVEDRFDYWAVVTEPYTIEGIEDKLR